MPTQVAPQTRRRSLIVHRSSFVTSLRKAGRHVRYICFRGRELPTDRPGIFSRGQESADVNRFIRSLDDPKSRDPKNGRPVAKLHKMVFSMRGSDWERSGLTNWRPVIREAMANVERQLGRRLEWVAAEHMSKSHPHCHVAIKAVTYDHAGRGYRLRLDPASLKLFRGEVSRVVVRELRRTREQDRLARRHLSNPRLAFRTVDHLLRFVQDVQRKRQLQEHQRLEALERHRAHEREGRGR